MDVALQRQTLAERKCKVNFEKTSAFYCQWILAVDFKHLFFPLKCISGLSPANITPTWLFVFFYYIIYITLTTAFLDFT